MLHYVKRYSFGVVIGVLVIFSFFMMNRKDNHDQELALSLNEASNEEPTDTEGNNEQEINTDIVVNIEGAIKKPGVYTMQDDSRAHDIVELAGGFTKEADQKQINLAQRLHDEMFLYIPSEEEEIMDIPSTSTGDNEQSNGEKLRVNQATVEELETLNGIGTSKAEAILQYIEENGPFQQVEDLLQVSGIGEKTLENFKEDIIIP